MLALMFSAASAVQRNGNRVNLFGETPTHTLYAQKQTTCAGRLLHGLLRGRQALLDVHERTHARTLLAGLLTQRAAVAAAVQHEVLRGSKREGSARVTAAVQRKRSGQSMATWLTNTPFPSRARRSFREEVVNYTGFLAAGGVYEVSGKESGVYAAVAAAVQYRLVGKKREQLLGVYATVKARSTTLWNRCWQNTYMSTWSTIPPPPPPARPCTLETPTSDHMPWRKVRLPQRMAGNRGRGCGRGGGGGRDGSGARATHWGAAKVPGLPPTVACS